MCQQINDVKKPQIEKVYQYELWLLNDNVLSLSPRGPLFDDVSMFSFNLLFLMVLSTFLINHGELPREIKFLKCGPFLGKNKEH